MSLKVISLKSVAQLSLSLLLSRGPTCSAKEMPASGVLVINSSDRREIPFDVSLQMADSWF